MKNSEEEYCKETFDIYLKSNFQGVATAWEDVEQKNEPPDYYLSISGDRYAVEVTILMSHLKAEGVNQPIAAIYALYAKLKTLITDAATKLGVLDGAYLISINKLIPDLRKKLPSIKKEALNYIIKNHGKVSAEKCTIYTKNEFLIKIKKIHNTKSYIAVNGSTLVRWQGEAEKELVEILKDAIETKKQKLRKISEKKLLLLYDGYHFAEKQQFILCVDRIDASDEFDAIFIVQQEYNGFLLYKKNCFNCNLTQKC